MRNKIPQFISKIQFVSENSHSQQFVQTCKGIGQIAENDKYNLASSSLCGNDYVRTIPTYILKN